VKVPDCSEIKESGTEAATGCEFIDKISSSIEVYIWGISGAIDKSL